MKQCNERSEVVSASMLCSPGKNDWTSIADVVFAFHGYVRIIHDLVQGHPGPECFHGRGFMQQGTPIPPFDMTVLNNISRYPLAIEAMFRSGIKNTSHFIDLSEQKRQQHRQYIREHFDNMPEIKNRKWS